MHWQVINQHGGAFCFCLGGNLFFWRRGLRLYRRWWKGKLQNSVENLLKNRFRGFSYGVFLGSEQFVEHMRGENG